LIVAFAHWAPGFDGTILFAAIGRRLAEAH
jgi:hypothetical protein